MKLVRLLPVPSYRRALRFGVAATIEHESVPFGPSPKTVIDVGAGRGQFALFARRRFPGAAIHSFEPLPDSARLVERALSGAAGFTLRRVAVGARAGTASIHVAADSDSSSLRRPTSNQLDSFPGTGSSGSLEVEVATLDDLFPEGVERPALLKLDLQGGELDALRGASALLGEIDEVFAEASFLELYEGQALADELVCHLRERGFGLVGVFSPSYGAGGVCLQADLLFRRAPDGEAPR